MARRDDLCALAVGLAPTALVATVFFSLNFLVLKQEGPIIDLIKQVAIPTLGTLAIALILVSLAYSGFTMYNINKGRFREDKRANYALSIAVGTAVLFLALSMSIGIYLA